MRRTITSVTIQPDLFAWAETAAQGAGVSRSRIIEWALDAFRAKVTQSLETEIKDVKGHHPVSDDEGGYGCMKCGWEADEETAVRYVLHSRSTIPECPMKGHSVEESYTEDEATL